MSVTVSTAVSATVSAIYNGNESSFLSETGIPILYPKTRPDSKGQEEYLQSLTIRANAAANTLGCGSILFGNTSESDDFGDVAFWLGRGKYGEGREAQVIEALHLQEHLAASARIGRIELDPVSHLPSSLGPLAAGMNNKLVELIKLLSRLEAVHCFSFEPTSNDRGLVACALVGQWQVDDAAVWVGLIGAGVWS